MKLYSFSPFPPGAYPYEQVFNGKIYKFPDMGLNIEQQALKIQQFRAANGIPRSTLAETIEDLNEFTCARLGNDPKWCGDGKRAVSKIAQRTQRRGCAGCGTRLLG